MSEARWVAGCLLAVCCFAAVAQDGYVPHDSQVLSQTSNQTWEQAVAALNAQSFAAKTRAADALLGFDHPQVRPILETWLAGLLYVRKSDKKVVLAAEDAAAEDNSFTLRDAATGEELGAARKRAIKKITVNNRLRKQLRGALAVLGIADPDPEQRLAAIRRLRDGMDPAALELLHAAAAEETDSRVREVAAEIFALEALGGADPVRRIEAIEDLGASLRLETYNELRSLSADEGEDRFIREKARKAADRVKMKRDVFAVGETIFFGVSLGSVLMLAAIGLAITFGVMGVINMAHGELIMLGAYTAYVMQQLMPGQAGLALLLAIPVAFVVSGGVGVLLEQTVIRFLYGRALETLLATFGISLILQQLVRSVFSPLNRPVSTPDWMSGAWQFNDAFSLTYSRLYILLFSLLVFAVLLFVVKHTGFGLQLRATSQNRAMARAMGVRSGWVDALTFGLGSGIAGIAGVGLSQLTNVGPNMGQAYIIDSFMVIVFGGTGNLWGVLYASMFLGTINKIFEPYTGAMLAKIMVLVFIILFIQKRPRGLFPQRGRAADA